MRNKLIALCAVAALFLVLMPQTLKTSAQAGYDDVRDLPEREEINQTYKLAPGARVELSIVAGPVTIETNTGDTAFVHIIRSAETRDELDCYRVDIENTPASLVIRHHQNSASSCYSVRSRQRVTLSLPRNIDLRLNAISGPVKIGEIDGNIHLSGISGRVNVEPALGRSEISGISGVLVMNISKLSDHGIHISGISGRVELHLAGDLNANVSVSGILGNID